MAAWLGSKGLSPFATPHMMRSNLCAHAHARCLPDAPRRRMRSFNAAVTGLWRIAASAGIYMICRSRRCPVNDKRLPRTDDPDCRCDGAKACIAAAALEVSHLCASKARNTAARYSPTHGMVHKRANGAANYSSSRQNAIICARNFSLSFSLLRSQRFIVFASSLSAPSKRRL